MYNIEIQDLKYALVLESEKSYRKAAERLGVSRQAISQSIKKIEHLTQFTLFNQVNHSILPTSIGELFLKEAKNIVFNYATMEQQFCPNSLIGSINLIEKKMITISLTTLLPDFVDTRLFSSFFSNKQIVLRSNFKDSDSVLDDIQTDHCDMGFVVSDGLMLQPFETIELISLRPVLLIPLSNPMSQNKIISSDDLEGLSVVTSGRHTHLGKLLVNNHDKQPYKTDLIAESNNLTFNIEYARKMNAACLVFHSKQNKNFVDFKEVPLMTDAPIDYGLYAVRHRRGTVSPVCEQFWDYIREYNFNESC